MWCKVADDSVVVNKSQPMKAGNGVEVKTEMTSHLLTGGSNSQKHYCHAKG